MTRLSGAGAGKILTWILVLVIAHFRFTRRDPTSTVAHSPKARNDSTGVEAWLWEVSAHRCECEHTCRSASPPPIVNLTCTTEQHYK